MKTKSCIYYTPNDLDPLMLGICQKQLRDSWDGEIVVSSLQPIEFGDKHVVLEGWQKSYPTYLNQILAALKLATTDYVFFTEHDVLYHPSFFEITPERDDIYYYNTNTYRWRYLTDIAIYYENLTSLSQMCCNRELAIRHYEYRIKVMEEQGFDKDRWREPRWARRFGYEPGTKKIRRGGITDEDCERWKARYPTIDIRHRKTFSHPKTFRREFKHLPETFVEVDIHTLPYWNLREMFKDAQGWDWDKK